jgi:hypothetical protein
MFGGYLVRAGEDAARIGVSNEAVEAINACGLVVEAKDGSIATIPNNHPRQRMAWTVTRPGDSASRLGRMRISTS